MAGGIIDAYPSVIDDSTTDTSSSIDKTYTVSGNGVIVIFAGIANYDTDYGQWSAEIRHNGNIVMAEGTRFGSANASGFGSSIGVPLVVSNNDTIKIWLVNTKGTTKYVFRRFLCFGNCSVS